MDDQNIRLGLTLTGTETFTTAAGAAGRLRDEFGKFVASAGAAEKATQKVTQAVETGVYELEGYADEYMVVGHRGEALAASMNQVANATANVTAKVTTAAAKQQELAKATAGTTDHTKGAQQGFLDLSRAAQDFAQGGFPAIVNNLEGIGRAIPALLANPVAMLGSLPALLTAGGVALLVFGPKLLGMAKEFGLFGDAAKAAKDRVETLKDRIKELEGKDVKLTIEVQELEAARKEVDAIKDALAAVERLSKLRSSVEKNSGAEVEKAIGEAPGGGDAAKDLLRRQIIEEQTANSPDVKAAEAALEKARTTKKAINVGHGQVAFVRDDEGIAAAQAALDRANDAIQGKDGTANRKVGDIYGDATTGSGEAQRKAQEEMARRFRVGGREDLAHGVEMNTPAALTKQKDEDEQDEAWQKQIDEGQKKGEEARERAKKAQAKKDKKSEAFFALMKTVHGWWDAEDKAKEKAGADQAGAEQQERQRKVAEGIAALVKDATASGLAGQAQQADATYRQQGGIWDEVTQAVTPADRKNQKEALRSDILRMLRERNPGADVFALTGAADQIAEGASNANDPAARAGQRQANGGGFKSVPVAGPGGGPSGGGPAATGPASQVSTLGLLAAKDQAYEQTLGAMAQSIAGINRQLELHRANIEKIGQYVAQNSPQQRFGGKR